MLFNESKRTNAESSRVFFNSAHVCRLALLLLGEDATRIVISEELRNVLKRERGDVMNKSVQKILALWDLLIHAFTTHRCYSKHVSVKIQYFPFQVKSILRLHYIYKCRNGKIYTHVLHTDIFQTRV